MAAPYINTPATERGGGDNDTTTLSAPHIDFSFAQPFASPSKNLAENLRTQMRGMRGQPQTAQTPRVRNALIDKRNPGGAKQHEFTPLLKSAHRNKILRRSAIEDKENAGAPDAPDAFRSSYASQGEALPVNSSILDGGDTGSFANANGEGTPVAPVASSSMLNSTPMPQLPKRGEVGVLDQGNVLTLRDQEAKLDQIQKDNFGLKLKIHFLEEALRKTGTSFQQATLKENVELKTEKMTLEQDLKRQRKRVQDAGHELDEYRLKYEEYQKWVKKRHANEQETEELERLQRMAEESQRIAQEREEELTAIRQRLEEAESEEDDNAEELQRLQRIAEESQKIADEREEELDAMQQRLEEAEAEEDKSAEELERLQRKVEESQKIAEEREEQLEAMRQRLQFDNSAEDRRDEELQRLHKMVEESQRTANKREQDLDDMHRRLESAESAKESSDEKVHRLQDMVEEHRKTASKREQELNEIRQGLEVAELADDRSAKELQRFQRMLEDSQKTLHNREQDLNDMRQQLEEAESAEDKSTKEVERLLSVIDDNKKTANRHEQESKMMRQRLQEAESEAGNSADVQKLKDDIQDLEMEVRDRERRMNEQNEQLDSLRDQIRAPKSDDEVRNLKNDVRELQKQIRDRERQLEIKGKEVDSLQDHIQSVKNEAEVQELNNDIRDLKKEVRDREDQLDAKDKEIQSLRYKMNSMTNDADLQQLRNEVHEAEMVTVAKDRKIAELEDEMLLLELSLDESQAGHAKLEIQVRELGGTISDLRSRLDKTSYAKDALARDLIREKKALKDLSLRAQEEKALVTEASHRENDSRVQREMDSKHHDKELRALALQIQYLHAKCHREESFRENLVYTKRWFLMQVDMYQKCNKADLKLLEDMGITPDITVRERRPSLKTAGLAIIACGRMQRMQQAWAGSKASHDNLLKALSAKKRRQARLATN